jgi:hypothetical protein
MKINSARNIQSSYNSVVPDVPSANYIKLELIDVKKPECSSPSQNPTTELYPEGVQALSRLNSSFPSELF